MKQLDSYSILIVGNYLHSSQDYINLIQVCKKFELSLDKYRYNPIPITSTKLFPLMETQYLYDSKEKRCEDVELYKINYPISYSEYLKCMKQDNIKVRTVYFQREDIMNFNGIFPEEVHSLKANCFKHNRSINSLIIPSTITSIGMSCFHICSNLQNIQLSPTMKM